MDPSEGELEYPPEISFTIKDLRYKILIVRGMESDVLKYQIYQSTIFLVKTWSHQT